MVRQNCRRPASCDCPCPVICVFEESQKKGVGEDECVVAEYVIDFGKLGSSDIDFNFTGVARRTFNLGSIRLRVGSTAPYTVGGVSGQVVAQIDISQTIDTVFDFLGSVVNPGSGPTIIQITCQGNFVLNTVFVRGFGAEFTCDKLIGRAA